MLPPFDLQGGVPLCAARTAFVCALLSVFGTLVFRVVVAPSAFSRMAADDMAAVKRHLLILAQASIAAGLMANAFWLVVQAGLMAEAPGVRQSFGAVPEVLTGTAFGHVLLAQSMALAVCAIVLGVRDSAWRAMAGLGLATCALCLQAGHSHAFSMYDGPSVLLACDVLHLAGAGAWLGGLLPLLVLVRDASPQAGAIAARWFSPLGQGCIAALVVSAAYQGWVLIATIPGLVGTAYGWVAVGKLALFGVLLGFAALNRYRFAPALLRGESGAAKRVLVRSVALQTCAAAAIVAAAVVLSGLPPAMHEQPVWPFAHRLSLDAVSEDPDFRAELVWACVALSGAALGVAVAFMARRWRAGACVAASVVGWFALPHLDFLVVPAYPTSFYHSPTGFESDAIVQGGDIYARQCVACHGADGRGDHAGALQLATPPADLTAAHLWMHGDGELFWWVSHGITTPEGAQAMPGFASSLDDDALWEVIDFIRARNAGSAMHAGGAWSHTIQAPGFTAVCGGESVRSADLRGHFVRLRIGGPTPAHASDGVVTILAASAAARVPEGVCLADDETVPLAYAIASGLDAQHMAGTEFLIDEAGWLRAMQLPGAAASWSNPAALSADIAALRARKMGGEVEAPMKMPM